MASIIHPVTPMGSSSLGIVAGEGTFVGVPCPTLYVQNLNEKCSVELLQKELFYSFCPFGKIYDIKIKKNMKMKGQAFIAFESIENASKALIALQGNILLYKPLVVRFARFKSFVASKIDGTFDAEVSKQEIDKGNYSIL